MTMMRTSSTIALQLLVFVIGLITFNDKIVFVGSLSQQVTSSRVLLKPSASVSRKHILNYLTAAGLATVLIKPKSVKAVDIIEESEAPSSTSRIVFTDDEIKDIVTKDILERQFLATGQLTRAIYQPTATFTDEIDTYKLEQWITGTQKLFVGDKSSVRLVGPVQVSKEAIEFQFDENLMFNIPFRPVVALSGKVILQRDPESGLISSYREIWDQDVITVLKSAKFR